MQMPNSSQSTRPDAPAILIIPTVELTFQQGRHGRVKVKVSSEIKDFVGTLSRLHAERRLDEMIDMFSWPLPIYSPNGLELKPNRAEVKDALARLLQAAKIVGTRNLVHQIISVRPTHQNAATVVHMEWNYLGAGATQVGRSEMNLFCGRDRRERMRIFMVEYLKMSFEDVKLRRLEDAGPFPRPN
jgi:hypothetical protein